MSNVSYKRWRESREGTLFQCSVPVHTYAHVLQTEVITQSVNLSALKGKSNTGVENHPQETAC